MWICWQYSDYVLISLKGIKPLNAETPRRRENPKNTSTSLISAVAFPLRLCGQWFVFILLLDM
jgi:hypothetical protein